MPNSLFFALLLVLPTGQTQQEARGQGGLVDTLHEGQLPGTQSGGRKDREWTQRGKWKRISTPFITLRMTPMEIIKQILAPLQTDEHSRHRSVPPFPRVLLLFAQREGSCQPQVLVSACEKCKERQGKWFVYNGMIRMFYTSFLFSLLP